MAWTIAETFRHYDNGNKLISLACISDANASAYSIDTYLEEIKGMFLYLVKTVPGTGDDAPTGTFDLDLEDADASHILDTDANANNAVAFHEGSATLGRDPMILDALGVVCATLGNLNTARIDLYFSNTPQIS